MAKRKRRAFPGEEPVPQRRHSETIDADDSVGGIFGFFRDYGVRETLESIFIAIILALMFKAFEAEAFIIPTGSMAPSLQGQHIDLECEQCSYRFRTGSSRETWRPLATHCPICRAKTELKRNNADHVSNNGDRILVNKFIYDFKDPERYDVIVFKYPNNGKQNYIKRLIGLPGDNILIENGDIYLMNPDGNGGWTREISRKPSKKVLHVLSDVDDTDFIGESLSGGKVVWPSRWNQYRDAPAWTIVEASGSPTFLAEAKPEQTWLRYRHNGPFSSDVGLWNTIKSGKLPSYVDVPLDQLPPGRLITDYSSYNDGLFRMSNPSNGESKLVGRGSKPETNMPGSQGLHWVGDIGLEAWFNVKSSSGELSFDLVEGGAHFTVRVDVATGQATLSCDSTDVAFVDNAGGQVASPSFSTNIKGTGEHHVRMVNADDQIHLWIDNRLVEFSGMKYLRSQMPIPTYDPAGDPGDAEPAGIGAKNLAVSVSRLKIVRDLYYSSYKNNAAGGSLDNETGASPNDIVKLFNNPEAWSNPASIDFFKLKRNQERPMFELTKGATAAKDQFLPMGDNSTESSDSRVWGSNHYVERDMLIGRAIFVYWPHTLNKPVKYFPNFKRMGFIR